ncbi:hypothetical protein A2115_01205 [Candidatus Woesebacteria bacterium GWA1_41_8]|jgi:ADP-ribose pyrophosphatase YjhB (NUDIX family)|uniref:Oxidized purine nucleoside triphosphate hydrolase n=1 Tax=Candidatus Woesebacteria bacterium GWA1_41_8 TaxID=1802471 RepID=A0A1F7WIH7_9BACT|nr:MAG: hypothetical protein A2115_01205 [Candidatus Woesebacteria bacterium GWA1_41_8]
MRKATLCFLVKGDKVLLAMKKRGFGKGLWNGVGGKKTNGETIRQAAIRETEEDIAVVPIRLHKIADLRFLFPHKTEWSQNVVAYIVDSWKGEPRESEEMMPKWFNKNTLPFKHMWWDDHLWLPQVLQGKKLKAKFIFNANNEVVSHAVSVFEI